MTTHVAAPYSPVEKATRIAEAFADPLPGVSAYLVVQHMVIHIFFIDNTEEMRVSLSILELARNNGSKWESNILAACAKHWEWLHARKIGNKQP